MTEEQFRKSLAELKIRFNTNPKLYLKSDYDLLLKLLLEVKTSLETNIETKIEALDELKADKEDIPTLLSQLTDDLGDSPEHTHKLYETALLTVNNLISAINTAKQDKLIAGANISITGSTISAVDTIYDDTLIRSLIAAKLDPLTAGTNISIENNTVDCTLDVSNKMEADGSNYVAGLTLVSPSVSCTWTVKNQSGVTKSTSTSNSLSVENGAKVDFNGTWKYPAPTSTQKVPTSCSGSWGTTLPAVNVSSSSKTDSALTSNTSYSLTIYAAKSGLEVSGNRVVKATGNDSNSASASVSFYHRRFWGENASESADITSLYSELSNISAKEITFNCSGGKYFYYAYPKVLGESSWKVGGLSFTGYTLTETTITNEYGLSVEYYIYRSTDKQTGSEIKAIIS